MCVLYFIGGALLARMGGCDGVGCILDSVRLSRFHVVSELLRLAPIHAADRRKDFAKGPMVLWMSRRTGTNSTSFLVQRSS